MKYFPIVSPEVLDSTSSLEVIVNLIVLNILIAP